ncbi:hypothetical protein ACF1G0_09140 [Streptomyces sp. NPDC013953]|uniref:hypothetical protein n=1 Tax=Streptomyces sp. NPDC013953 TaxID=3364868 RepID=UPI0036F7D251
MTRDALTPEEELRRLLPPPGDPVLPADRRSSMERHLMSEIHRSRTGRADEHIARVRPVPRVRRVLLAGAAATAALAVAVPLAQRPEAAPPRTDSPTFLLAAAADQAARQPGGKRYWQTTGTDRQVVVARGLPTRFAFTCTDTVTVTVDTAAGKRGRTTTSVEGQGCRGLTPADTAAWKQAGSPATFTNTVGGRTVVKGENSTRELVRGPGAGAMFPVGRALLPLEEVRALPDSPEELKALLSKKLHPRYDKGVKAYDIGPLDELRGLPPEEARRLLEKRTLNRRLFAAARDIVLDLPAEPGARAAAFRLLAGLPKVKVTEHVEDEAGRKGTAVSLPAFQPPMGQVEERLVFDPASSRGLASETVLVRSDPGTPASLRPGTVVASRTVSAAEWSHTAP